MPASVWGNNAGTEEEVRALALAYMLCVSSALATPKEVRRVLAERGVFPGMPLFLLGGFLSISTTLAQQSPERSTRELEAQVTLLKGGIRGVEERIGVLQQEVQQLRSKTSSAATGGMLAFLFGAFCALWAQNTNRSWLLWFLAGALLSVVAVIVLLIKNSNDRERARRRKIYERRVADR